LGASAPIQLLAASEKQVLPLTTWFLAGDWMGQAKPASLCKG